MREHAGLSTPSTPKPHLSLSHSFLPPRQDNFYHYTTGYWSMSIIYSSCSVVQSIQTILDGIEVENMMQSVAYSSRMRMTEIIKNWCLFYHIFNQNIIPKPKLLFTNCQLCLFLDIVTSVNASLPEADSGCILCIHGYSQHIRQKLKENQFLLLISSQERANDGWKLV